MNSHFFLERHSENNKPQIINLGVLSHYSFYPTMTSEVFEILVKEANFQIKNDTGQVFQLDEFHQRTNYSFNNSPPVISLNALP